MQAAAIRDERCGPFRAAAPVRLEMGRGRAVMVFTIYIAVVPAAFLLWQSFSAPDRGESRRVHAGQLHLGLRLARDAAPLRELGPVRGRASSSLSVWDGLGG